MQPCCSCCAVWPVTPQTLDRAMTCGTLARLREEENIQLPYNNQNTLIHCRPVRILEFNFINVHGCNFMRFCQQKQQTIPMLDPLGIQKPMWVLTSLVQLKDPNATLLRP